MRMKHMFESPLFILFCVLLGGCGGKRHEPIEPVASTERISELREAYSQNLAKAKATYAEDSGWPSVTDCDGTLWAGIACAAGVPVHIKLAERDDGSVGRRPLPACYSRATGDQGARATFSNDMATGYLLCLWRTRDEEALGRWATYLEERNFVMGEPWPEEAGRLLLSGNGQRLLGRALYAITRGRVAKGYRHIPSAYLHVAKDYERHIQALAIILSGEIDETLRLESGDASAGGEEGDPTHRPALLDINDQMKGRLDELVQAEPENPLFHAAQGVYTGDFSRALDLLLSDQTPIPTYVRGDAPDAFWLAEWLFAADLILRRHK